MAFAKFKVKKNIDVGNNGNLAPLIPVGLIIPWSFSSAPDGWLLCDGSSVSPTIYTELYNIIGSVLPNIDGCIVIGAGTGSGGGLSATSGQITGGETLTARTVNSLSIASDDKNAINVLHSHTLSNHIHAMGHTHAYPHTHTSAHTHDFDHTHGTSPSAGPHQHAYGSVNSTGPGTQPKNVPSPGATTPSGGSHSHPESPSAVNVNPSGAPFGTTATPPTFQASPINTTTTAVLTTGSLGGTSTFPVRQQSVTVYFIIKY